MSREARIRIKRIRELLEMYQTDLLEIKNRSGGEIVRIRCEISDIINFLNFKLGDLGKVLQYELGNKYVGMKLTELEAYSKKRDVEILDSLESQLLMTGLPSYICDPIYFGLQELRKRASKDD